MDYALLLVFKNIKSSLICFVDGKEMTFQNGEEAIVKLKEENKHYSLGTLSAKDSTVVLEVLDITNEIESHNKEFIAEYKNRFGYEPSFF